MQYCKIIILNHFKKVYYLFLNSESTSPISMSTKSLFCPFTTSHKSSRHPRRRRTSRFRCSTSSSRRRRRRVTRLNIPTIRNAIPSTKPIQRPRPNRQRRRTPSRRICWHRRTAPRTSVRKLFLRITGASLNAFSVSLPRRVIRIEN